jgi:MFS family permease
MARGLGRDIGITAVILGGSALGDTAALVALVLRAHQNGDSGWAVTALLLAASLPPMLLARPTGALVDQVDSRVLMVGCALAQALLCLPLALAPPVWVMTALIAGLAAMGAIAGPARAALVPEMVEPAQLLRANAVLRAATTVGRMVGWPLGGYLSGLLGTSGVMLLDSASFVALAAGAMLIRSRRLPTLDCGPRYRGGLRVWVDGTVQPLVRLMAASIGVVFLFVASTNVVQVYLVKDVLGASDAGYGLTGACWMGGMLLAVPAMTRGRCTARALTTMIVAGEAVTGIAMLGVGLSPSLPVVAAWYLLGGLSSSVIMTTGTALVQLLSPASARGRVLAAYGALVNAASGVALVLSVPLMSVLGSRGVFFVAGVMAVTAAVLTSGARRLTPTSLIGRTAVTSRNGGGR